jgi:hypothetical protein
LGLVGVVEVVEVEVVEVEVTLLRPSCVEALVRRFWVDFGRKADVRRLLRLGLWGGFSISIEGYSRARCCKMGSGMLGKNAATGSMETG